MITVNDIFTLYARDLGLVEDTLRGIFASDSILIPEIGEHIIRSGGKRLRPLFLLLSADLAGYRGEQRIFYAGVVEAIHTASLLHDDVVDGADTRRGRPAAQVVWGNQVVILVGDYIYANALRLSVARENLRIIGSLSEAITTMTEGEIIQLNRIADPDITLEEYYRIISAKTGALISAACRIGGILGGLPAEQEDALGRFGLKTGIAFQMADDILDYMADERGLGKKLGKDLEEGKITLPLIHLLREVSAAERIEVQRIVRDGASGGDGLTRIVELLDRYSAIEESLRFAQRLLAEAKEEIAIFADSPEKQALLMLSDYALAREK